MEGSSEEQYQDDCGSFVYFINPRQYNRIIIRRLAKEKMIKEGRWPDKRQRIMHLSRSRHSIARVRTADGKFAGGSSNQDGNGQKTPLNEPEKQPLKEARWVPIVPGPRSAEFPHLPCGFFVKLDPHQAGQVEVVVEQDGTIFIRPSEEIQAQS